MPMSASPVTRSSRCAEKSMPRSVCRKTAARRVQTRELDAADSNVVRAIDNLSSRLESELGQDDSFIADMIGIKQIIWLMRSYSGEDRTLSPVRLQQAPAPS